MQDINHLYQAHGPALLGYLRRSFGRSGSPEDMLQDTFVHAMRRPDQLAKATSPRAWLFGIARHVGLTAVRQYRPNESIDLAEPRSAEWHSAEPNVELAEMREAIAQLPQTLREPLELKLREGLSYEEIAAVLEIPIGTVRSRLHTTLHRLREAMDVK